MALPEWLQEKAPTAGPELERWTAQQCERAYQRLLDLHDELKACTADSDCVARRVGLKFAVCYTALNQRAAAYPTFERELVRFGRQHCEAGAPLGFAECAPVAPSAHCQRQRCVSE